MTTDREKIITLAQRCAIRVMDSQIEGKLIAFYKAAQAEAFEAAAVRLEGKLAHTFGRHCAETIREMAKEMK